MAPARLVVFADPYVCEHPPRPAFGGADIQQMRAKFIRIVIGRDAGACAAIAASSIDAAISDDLVGVLVSPASHIVRQRVHCYRVFIRQS